MAAECRPWPWRTRNQDSKRKKSWLREEGKLEKKETNEKERRPFYPLACPLASLLFPLHPSISQGRRSLGPKRTKEEKREIEGEKKAGNLSVEHHTCVEFQLWLVREGKGRLWRRERENKIGECIRETWRSLTAINKEPKSGSSTHTPLLINTHTQNKTLIYCLNC